MARHKAPRSIGRYEIRRELGHGTMGVVYEAWDPALGRTIALKTVSAFSLSRAERNAYEQRFLTEARAAARLSHPGIVVVHDVGRDAESGLLFMALEHLDGETLADRIASGRRIEWREALRIIGRVAEALHHAHTQGVIHRDVKPANVMILRSGEPKILDFGIARIDAGHLTTPGELFGTPLYMAPEQALGRPVDARSDLFSLGTIAYTLLTSQAPFAAPSVPAILARVAHRSAPPPSELVPGLPREIDDVLARAMAKAPEDRYPTGQMMAEDVEDVLGGRPPRHRAAWTPPPAAERTLFSRALEGDIPALDLVEEAKARPRKRGRWRSRLERLALLALAAAAAVHFWVHPEDVSYWLRAGREVHRRLSGLTTPSPPEPGPGLPTPSPVSMPTAATETLEPPSSLEPGPGTAAEGLAEGTTEGPMAASPVGTSVSPAAAPQAGVGTAGLPPAEPSPAEPTAPEPTPPGSRESSTPSEAMPPSPSSPADAEGNAATPITSTAAPSAGPAPGSTATPAPSPGARKDRPASPSPRLPQPAAWLSIGFEHHLASGTLEVWVDGRRVVREALDSRATRKLLGFELRKGSVQQTLGLEPGRHEVRVRLRSGDDDKTAHTSTIFRSGATRRLEVSAPRLRGGLSLEWK